MEWDRIYKMHRMVLRPILIIPFILPNYEVK